MIVDMDRTSSGWWYYTTNLDEWILIDSDDLDPTAGRNAARVWAAEKGFSEVNFDMCPEVEE